MSKRSKPTSPAPKPRTKRNTHPPRPGEWQLTPKLIQQVCDLVAQGQTITAACRKIGGSPKRAQALRTRLYTWSAQESDHPEAQALRSALARAKEEGCDARFDQLYTIADKMLGAKNKLGLSKLARQFEAIRRLIALAHPQRYSEMKRHEVTQRADGAEEIAQRLSRQRSEQDAEVVRRLRDAAQDALDRVRPRAPGSEPGSEPGTNPAAPLLSRVVPTPAPGTRLGGGGRV